MMYVRTISQFVISNVYIFIGYYILMSVVAFICYLVDKIKAKRGTRRVSEAALLRLSFAGGCAGALIAMIALRHKTRKQKFRILVPLSLMVHLFAAAAVLYFSKN